jgi:hypothetical protein
MLDRYQVAEEKGLISDDGVIMQSKKRIEENDLVEKWQCYDCTDGILRLVIFGNRYVRICDCCGKRTKSQIWDENVKGVQ